MKNIKELKKPIRAFMQAHYTDERLAQLLCHARDGKLSYGSCCCFIGVATADHALRSSMDVDDLCKEPHYRSAQKLLFAHAAEQAYFNFDPMCDNEKRRRILIPMIRAEMKRRAVQEWQPVPVVAAEEILVAVAVQ